MRPSCMIRAYEVNQVGARRFERSQEKVELHSSMLKLLQANVHVHCPKYGYSRVVLSILPLTLFLA